MKKFKKLYIEKFIEQIKPARNEQSWFRMLQGMIGDPDFSDETIEERNAICEAVDMFEKNGRQVFIFDTDAFWEIAKTEGSMPIEEVTELFPYECAYFQFGFRHKDGAIVFKNWENGPTMMWKDVPRIDTVVAGSGWDNEGRAVNEDGSIVKDLPPNFLYNLACYIAAKNADLNFVYQPPDNNVSVKKRQRRQSMAVITEVGFHVGAELREYKRRVSSSEHLGGTVRPHMRRAHWHRFWTGPKDGKRELVLRWLPPIFVNTDKGDIKTTVHIVKKDNSNE